MGLLAAGVALGSGGWTGLVRSFWGPTRISSRGPKVWAENYVDWTTECQEKKTKTLLCRSLLIILVLTKLSKSFNPQLFSILGLHSLLVYYELSVP